MYQTFNLGDAVAITATRKPISLYNKENNLQRKDIMKTLKSLVAAFKAAFIDKLFYQKLLAYCSIIGAMKYEGNEERPIEEWKPNDKYWMGSELPSIYDLDIITDEMNHQRDDINMTFKLNVNTWSRDDVRLLMRSFEHMYDGFCYVNNRKLSLFEVCAKLSSFVNCSFWQHWRHFYQMFLLYNKA